MRSGKAQRAALLVGEELQQWFGERGWRVTQIGDQTIRAFVDELAADGLTVRRIWHTPMTLERTSPDGLGTFLMQVEGEAEIGLRGDRYVRLSPKMSMLLPSSPFESLEATTPTARIEVSVTTLAEEDAPLLFLADDATAPVWNSVTALVNSMLNAGIDGTHPTYPAFRSALLSLVAGVSAGAREDGPGIYDQAQRIIERRALDTEFTVEALAAELNVSRQYLARTFRSRNSSPRNALRQQRMRTARMLIDAAPNTSLDQVARASGFPSTRALREAL